MDRLSAEADKVRAKTLKDIKHLSSTARINNIEID